MSNTDYENGCKSLIRNLVKTYREGILFAVSKNDQALAAIGLTDEQRLELQSFLATKIDISMRCFLSQLDNKSNLKISYGKALLNNQGGNLSDIEWTPEEFKCDFGMDGKILKQITAAKSGEISH
jgi:hypothetical protein